MIDPVLGGIVDFNSSCIESQELHCQVNSVSCISINEEYVTEDKGCELTLYWAVQCQSKVSHVG